MTFIFGNLFNIIHLQLRFDWIPGLAWAEMINPELCSTIFETVPLASHWPWRHVRIKKEKQNLESPPTLNLWQMLKWFTVQILLLWWLLETSLSLLMYSMNFVFVIVFSVSKAPPPLLCFVPNIIHFLATLSFHRRVAKRLMWRGSPAIWTCSIFNDARFCGGTGARHPNGVSVSVVDPQGCESPA